MFDFISLNVYLIRLLLVHYEPQTVGFIIAVNLRRTYSGLRPAAVLDK
jgi:hypothetical protein